MARLQGNAVGELRVKIEPERLKFELSDEAQKAIDVSLNVRFRKKDQAKILVKGCK